MVKVNFYGNSFIGVFARASDGVVFVPEDSQKKFEQTVNERLQVDTERMSIAGSGLLGIYSAMNSNGMVVPHLAYNEEIERIKKTAKLNVQAIKTKHTAIGNVICCNDKGAIVSTSMEKENVKKIEDCLGVEVRQMKIAGYDTVGSSCVATNRGLIIHNDASDEELEIIENLLKVEGTNSTVNFGFSFPSYGIIANSNGYVVGNLTTGIELMRIDQGLGFAKRG